jgi:hypothetical protein
VFGPCCRQALADDKVRTLDEASGPASAPEVGREAGDEVPGTRWWRWLGRGAGEVVDAGELAGVGGGDGGGEAFADEGGGEIVVWVARVSRV